MARPLGTLSTAALAALLAAQPAAAQDGTARFPAAESRAQLEAQRAWFLWTAEDDAQRVFTSLDEARKAAGSDAARKVVLDFYAAVAAERHAQPQAWQQQIQALAGSGVEPYSSWAEEQLSRPRTSAAPQERAARETPAYLSRWAGNLDDDEHMKNTMEAREELESLGVLAVPAILERLPEYGPLGLRHALPLLTPNLDETILRALEARMLEGDPSSLYVIASALHSMPVAPRQRLGALALTSGSMPARIEGAHACADSEPLRETVLEVLGLGLESPAQDVRDRATHLLVHPDLRDLPAVKERITELATAADSRDRFTMLRAWMYRRGRSAEEDRALYETLSEEGRAQFWDLRFGSVARQLSFDELLLVLRAGINVQAREVGTAARRNGLESIQEEFSEAEAARLAPVLTESTVHPDSLRFLCFRLGARLQTLPEPTLLALTERGDFGSDIYRYAFRALSQTAPRTALRLQRNEPGVDRFAGDAQELFARLAEVANPDDIPQLVDHFQGLESVIRRRGIRSAGFQVGQAQSYGRLIAQLSNAEHLELLLPLYARRASSRPPQVQAALLERFPSPGSVADAEHYLDWIDRLPITVVQSVLPRLPEYVRARNAERIAAAIQRCLARPEEGYDPDFPPSGPMVPSQDPVRMKEPAEGLWLARRLIPLLARCGPDAQPVLFGLLSEQHLSSTAFETLRGTGGVSEQQLAAAVFGEPGIPAQFDRFLSDANFPAEHVVLSEAIRPLVVDRLVADRLGNTDGLNVTGFLRALEAEQRLSVCEQLLTATTQPVSAWTGGTRALAKSALKVLGEARDPKLCATLAIPLRGTDPELQELAIDALQATMSKAAAPYLLPALTDPNYSVREGAESALETIRGSLETRDQWREWVEKNVPESDRKR